MAARFGRKSAYQSYHFSNGTILATDLRQHFCRCWDSVGPFLTSHLGSNCWFVFFVLYTQETKNDRLKSLWIAFLKFADSKYFRLIVLWGFESASFFNRLFDPRAIKSLLSWIVCTLLAFVKLWFTDVNRNFTIEMNNSRNVS